jgi:hypothetical protein
MVVALKLAWSDLGKDSTRPHNRASALRGASMMVGTIPNFSVPAARRRQRRSLVVNVGVVVLAAIVVVVGGGLLAVVPVEANTTAYCTRNFNINATSKARVTSLPNIKISIVVEKNSGTMDVYEGQGNLTVIRGDGTAVWDRIEKFSNAHKDAMILVLRNNVGTVNVFNDEQLWDDDYYYDTSKDREKNGEAMEVAHFGQNKGLMEISAGTSQALFVILKDNAAKSAAHISTSTAFVPFSVTDANATTAKPIKLETCNLYDLMDVNAVECYGCPAVNRGGGTLQGSATQCVHKVSEICSCGVFKQGNRKCVKRVVSNQCKHTIPSNDQFSAEVIKQYGRYCQSQRKKN